MTTEANSNRPAYGGPLLEGAGWAVLAAMAGREGGLLPACLVGLLALGRGLLSGRVGAWVWAFPAGFAAAVPAPTVCWPRPGPVLLAGEVLPRVEVDPVRGHCSFRVIHGGQIYLCIVTDPPTDLRVLPGDTVHGPARLPDQLERRRRGALPRVIMSGDALTVEPGSTGLWRLATRCRLAMQRSLLRHVPGEPGILLCHLVLGRGPELRGDLVAAHRATGLSHLLAVSGAHLTMLGWMLGLLFAITTRRSPLGSAWFRRGCGIVLLFYGLITGMDPPVFRAVVAAFVFLIGTGRGRPVPIVAVLALPAIMTAVLAPADLFGVSFNLSYAAVIGLALSGGLRGRSTWERWLIGPLLCSCWATLLTMPFTLWYFGRLAPWTVLATPLLSPLVAAMLGVGLTLTGVATLLPAFAPVVALPLAGLTQLYCGAVRCTAELPFAPVYADVRPALAVLVAAGLVGLILLLHLRDRRGVAALCLSLSLPHFAMSGATADPGLQLVAVGHGHAGLLTMPNDTRVLVDCGSLGNPRRAARAVTEALLPRRRIDWLVLTHGDFDHIGGVVPLLGRVRVAGALLPDEMRGGDVATALAGQGCRLLFLAPGERRLLCDGLLAHRPAMGSHNRNDQSAWVHVDFQTFRAILTGDALEAGTAAWLDSDLAERAEVLVLPHHGRAQGEATRLLATVQPRLALVSSATGDGNTEQGRQAHAAGCRVLHTGVVGTIHVRATAPPEVTTERPWQLLQRRN